MARQRILFSCVGTTDPVRGQRDGGVMHIARRYKPEKIRLFLSAEMEKNITLYERAFAFMREHWNYAPEVSITKSGIQDPSDLDQLDGAMEAAFEAFADTCPNAEILVNLSSGTPQMEIILSQLVISSRYNVKGIQVKNPERKAGTTERVNSPRYNPEEELEHNQDELPDAPNRCVTPGLFPIRRERQWRELRTLLERGDYAAALARAENCLSPALADVIEHLRLRDLLRDDEAREIAGRLPPELNLYPGSDTPDYWQSVNYWLMMKNMLRTGRYSDFLFRLSVLALALEEAEIKSLLARDGLSYDALTYARDDYNGDRVLSMDALREQAGTLYQKLLEIVQRQKPGEKPRDDRSVYLYTRLLKCIGTPKSVMKLFNLCDTLSAKRNDVAHRMSAITEAEFVKATDRPPEKLEKEIEAVIAAVYPQCDRSAFSLHERALAYIENNR